jgi:pimeloyl-ACP methyl ester carboxylesterase
VAAALLVLALPLSGCSVVAPLVERSSSPTGEDVPSGLERFYTQQLSWSSCETGMECATAIAPLDWAEPSGDTIELALIRSRATGSSPIGSVLVNPGGPGASGVDWLASGADVAVDAAVHKEFDVVSWDPRGVGRSTAVDCGSDADLDRFIYEVDPDEPQDEGSDAWFAYSQKWNEEFGAACLAGTGPLLGHISTTDSARDLDMLRAALGDKLLTYVGYSAGTLLGSIYAELFPDKTGRMVLDGAVDPAKSYVESSQDQSLAFDAALKSYLTWCLGEKDCPFSGSVDDALADIGDLYDDLDASPLTNSDGRKLDSGVMQTAVDFPLYSEDNWPYLSDAFTSAFQGDPSYPFYLADLYNDRGEDGTYKSNLVVAFPAIQCLDYPAKATPDEARAIVAADTGDYLFDNEPGYSAVGCAGWPFDADREPAPITVAGSHDILVLGTTGDPATPYADAVSLADQLENGHLVTYAGEGHTVYNGNSSCVNDTVDAFLLEGTVPASDPKC